MFLENVCNMAGPLYYSQTKYIQKKIGIKITGMKIVRLIIIHRGMCLYASVYFLTEELEYRLK